MTKPSINGKNGTARSAPWLLSSALALVLGTAAGAPVLAQQATLEGAPLVHYHPAHTAQERAKAVKNAATGNGVPTWSGSILSPVDNNTYAYTMLGSSPFSKTIPHPAIRYQPIILKVTVTNSSTNPPTSVTQDPTVAACGDTETPEQRWLQSPLFVPVPFTTPNPPTSGADVTAGVGGSAQLGAIYQRASFWAQTQNTDYTVNLETRSQPVIATISLPGTTRTYSCASGTGTSTVGRVDVTAYKDAVAKIVAANTHPDQIALVMTYNITLWGSNNAGEFVATGFHDYFDSNGTNQYYATSSYYDPSAFPGWKIQDIESWGHELIEMIADPFTTNPTPPWQTPGATKTCQNNLEPGDPINAFGLTPYPIQGAPPGPGVPGYIYHLQDVAYFSWFYRLPATGAGGLYSLYGSLTAYQPTVCRN